MKTKLKTFTEDNGGNGEKRLLFRLLCYLCFLLFISSAFPQSALPGTVIASEMTTGDTNNVFSIGDTALMKGTPKAVSSIAWRNAIATLRRVEGMQCAVTNGNSTYAVYRLVGGIDNTNWTLIETNGSSVSAISLSGNAVGATFDAANGGFHVFSDGSFNLAGGNLFGNADGSFGQLGGAFYVSPTHALKVANLTNDAMTASAIAGTDANKALTSIGVGAGLLLSGGTLSATGGGGGGSNTNVAIAPIDQTIGVQTNSPGANYALQVLGVPAGTTNAIASLALSHVQSSTNSTLWGTITLTNADGSVLVLHSTDVLGGGGTNSSFPLGADGNANSHSVTNGNIFQAGKGNFGQITASNLMSSTGAVLWATITLTNSDGSALILHSTDALVGPLATTAVAGTINSNQFAYFEEAKWQSPMAFKRPPNRWLSWYDSPGGELSCNSNWLWHAGNTITNGHYDSYSIWVLQLDDGFSTNRDVSGKMIPTIYGWGSNPYYGYTNCVAIVHSMSPNIRVGKYIENNASGVTSALATNGISFVGTDLAHIVQDATNTANEGIDYVKMDTTDATILFPEKAYRTALFSYTYKKACANLSRYGFVKVDGSGPAFSSIWTNNSPNAQLLAKLVDVWNPSQEISGTEQQIYEAFVTQMNSFYIPMLAGQQPGAMEMEGAIFSYLLYAGQDTNAVYMRRSLDAIETMFSMPLHSGNVGNSDYAFVQTNADLYAIDAGGVPQMVYQNTPSGTNVQVWKKTMVDGRTAIAFWNRSYTNGPTITLNVSNQTLGLVPQIYLNTDVLFHTNFYWTNNLTVTLQPAETKLYIVTPSVLNENVTLGGGGSGTQATNDLAKSFFWLGVGGTNNPSVGNGSNWITSIADFGAATYFLGTASFSAPPLSQVSYNVGNPSPAAGTVSGFFAGNGFSVDDWAISSATARGVIPVILSSKPRLYHDFANNRTSIGWDTTNLQPTGTATLNVNGTVTAAGVYTGLATGLTNGAGSQFAPTNVPFLRSPTFFGDTATSSVSIFFSGAFGPIWNTGGSIIDIVIPSTSTNLTFGSGVAATPMTLDPLGAVTAAKFTASGSGFTGNGAGMTNIPNSAIQLWPLTNNQTTATTFSNNFTVDSSHGITAAGGITLGTGGTNLQGRTVWTNLPTTAATGMLGLDSKGNTVSNAVPSGGGGAGFSLISSDSSASGVTMTASTSVSFRLNTIDTGGSTTVFPQRDGFGFSGTVSNLFGVFEFGSALGSGTNVTAYLITNSAANFPGFVNQAMSISVTGDGSTSYFCVSNTTSSFIAPAGMTCAWWFTNNASSGNLPTLRARLSFKVY